MDNNILEFVLHRAAMPARPFHVVDLRRHRQIVGISDLVCGYQPRPGIFPMSKSLPLAGPSWPCISSICASRALMSLNMQSTRHRDSDKRHIARGSDPSTAPVGTEAIAGIGRTRCCISSLVGLRAIERGVARGGRPFLNTPLEQ
jgi:hypothetical protein